MQLDQLIYTLTQSAELPLLTAFLLGIATALNPCQLAISISAITYITRHHAGEGDQQPAGIAPSTLTPLYHTALLYPLGRAITYIILAWVRLCLAGETAHLNGATHLFSIVETMLPYMLCLIGIFLLTRSFIHHHDHSDDCHHSGLLISRNGPLGSLILGITLAFAFCPESAIIYFGGILPLSFVSNVGILIPIAFALGATIPVIVLALLLHRLTSHVQRATHSLEHFQQVFNIISGIIFIIIGILLFFE